MYHELLMLEIFVLQLLYGFCYVNVLLGCICLLVVKAH